MDGLTIYLSDWVETSLVRWRLAGASACLACGSGTYANATGVGNAKYTLTFLVRGVRRGGGGGRKRKRERGSENRASEKGFKMDIK
jgi:hypothetical protein